MKQQISKVQKQGLAALKKSKENQEIVEKAIIIQMKDKNKNNIISVVNGKIKSALMCVDETKTQQQYKKQQDIKEIIKKYNATGLLNKNIMANDPMFDDVSEIKDYQDAQNSIAKAAQEFDKLPEAVRAKFNYNPAALLDYLNDSENKEEAIELGLVKKDIIPEKSSTDKLLEEIVKNTQESSSSGIE